MSANGSDYFGISHKIDSSKVEAAAKTRAINTAVDVVKGAIRSLTDDDRKVVLGIALRELSSTLGVHKRRSFFYSLSRK